MGSFEVAVFTTSDLYWDCSSEFGDGYEARDIAAEFIEGAFSRSTNHTVTVLKPDTRVSAPQEQINDSFKAQPPCSGPIGTWEDLRDWWDYWVNDAACKDPHTEAADCNLLLTGASGGGLGGPREACAGGAFTIANNYDSYQNWDDQPAFNQVDTVLEELGHTLVSDMSNEDDGTIPHDSGRLYEHNGTYAITPIGITGDTDYNNCNEYVNKSRWDENAWEARYSPCTEEHFS